jgi:hypothetical protein
VRSLGTILGTESLDEALSRWREVRAEVEASIAQGRRPLALVSTGSAAQNDPLGDLYAWAWPQSPVKDHQHTLAKPPMLAEGDRLDLAEVRQAIFAFGG